MTPRRVFETMNIELLSSAMVTYRMQSANVLFCKMCLIHLLIDQTLILLPYKIVAVSFLFIIKHIDFSDHKLCKRPWFEWPLWCNFERISSAEIFNLIWALPACVHLHLSLGKSWNITRTFKNYKTLRFCVWPIKQYKWGLPIKQYIWHYRAIQIILNAILDIDIDMVKSFSRAIPISKRFST